MDERAARVLKQFRLVFNSVKAHFRAVEKKAGLAGAQVWALSVVCNHPGIGVGGMARAMEIHQSTASNLLKPLLEAGLVSADRSGEDRRAVHLHITPAGMKILRKAPRPLTGVLPQALARLDKRTLHRLEKDLDQLIALLGADERRDNVLLGESQA